MVRTLKPANVRKKEILDAALGLFMTRGYDGTAVNDILQITQLSKGAFYHHFSSKTEVLQALVDKMSEEGVAQAERLLGSVAPTVTARLNAFFGAGSRYKLDNAAQLRGLIQVLTRNENVRLRLAAQERIVEAIVPILARILEDGNRAGEISVDDPSETARVLLHLGQLINDAFAAGMRMVDREAAGAMCRTRIRTTERAIETLLGLDPRSFEIVSPDLIEAFFDLGDEGPLS
jgi:AcrR family transcriptional regulator